MRNSLSLVILLLTATFVRGQATEGPEPPDPEVFVRRFLTEVTETRNPAVVWRALPRGYRADVESLVGLAARELNREEWAAVCGLLSKGGSVIREHGDRLLGFAYRMGGREMPPEQRAAVSAGWRAAGEILALLGGSELSTPEGALKLDVERFLTTTGAEVVRHAAVVGAMLPEDAFAEAMTRLERLEVTGSERTAAGATVTLSSEHGESFEVSLDLVDGRWWVPRKLAGAWDQAIEDTRLLFLDRSGARGEPNPDLLSTVARYEAVLDDVLQAESEDDFAQAAVGFFRVVAELSTSFERLRSGFSDAKVALARAHVAALDAALKEYYIQNGGRWPDSLVALVTPDEDGYTYIDRRSIPLDPWKHEYRYDPPTAAEPRARVYSYGSDGKPGGVGDAADIDNWSL